MADWENSTGAAGTGRQLDDASNNPQNDEPKGPKDLSSADGWVQRTDIDYDAYTGNPSDRPQWDGSAPLYNWDGEEGDLGPEYPELEKQLFGERGESCAGIDFKVIREIAVVQEGPVRVEPALRFEDAGLHPAMLKNVELCGYKVPTPIQAYCIPAIHKGHDVIGIAQTGSGKTAAFLIPVINKLMGKAKKLAAPRPNPVEYNMDIHGPVRAEPLVVIVCPTRELAIQAFNEARKLCYRSMLRPGVVYGGGNFMDQIRQIGLGCDILCATPGRLLHFMDKPELLNLQRVRYVVIDEADEMLTADWEEDMKKIMSAGGAAQEIKYLLFSATFPKKIRDLAREHLSEDHVQLRVGRAGSTHSNIIQTVIETAPMNKKRALNDLINSMPPQRTIIFVNNKWTADELDDYLYNECKLPCTSMHADRTQREREDALRAFRAGTAPILVTTGVTARGIDVRNVAHVVNYDLPSMDHGGIEEYTHRIGRTGRIGNKGLATSFYTDRDEAIASVLVRTMLETNQEIPEFLSGYIPDGDARENLKFEADSDFEDNVDADDNAGGGWGSTDNGQDGNTEGATGDDATDDNNNNSWGTREPIAKSTGDGWGPVKANGDAKMDDSWTKGSGW
ncbi:hypothetical protein MCOR02_000633 [Pyricularia oryzae]|uniref:RNA helicase n=1 Tax=Pyricularia oryzae TaxID=318829 RepID=A0A4P7NTX0_PYROR|nr:hypothetical protein MCOR02_000633 [Pyricularia oryzae]KAI6324059.1 hypothetical protein MCOR34_001625 [Pyricularia oryzae]KAI6470190.1 hypothetical protein MCOR17_003594 [Pyricularia oryzae]KAI6507269.1 hypothetical protein MCOR13_002872 [Pyricularia oryzae]KAI6585420.1 hypothetical protein MCOR04_004695 [Pyricularia oryzae]